MHSIVSLQQDTHVEKGLTIFHARLRVVVSDDACELLALALCRCPGENSRYQRPSIARGGRRREASEEERIYNLPVLRTFQILLLVVVA